MKKKSFLREILDEIKKYMIMLFIFFILTIIILILSIKVSGWFYVVFIGFVYLWNEIDDYLESMEGVKKLKKMNEMNK